FTATGYPNSFSGTPGADSTHALVQIGDGLFDGTSTGHFSGSANGTVLAINTTSGYPGRLVDFQAGGVSRFNIGAAGLCTIAGNLAHTGGSVGFFGAAVATQQSGGALTAGATYGANEQSMLNKAYG